MDDSDSGLAGWMTPLPGAAEMREADRRAIEDLGIPGIELMERAASALSAAIEEISPDGTILIVCGKGSNGGDGLAAARILRDRGRRVLLMAASDPEDWRGDAAINLGRLPVADRPTQLSLPDEPIGCAADCVLGTGAVGAPSGPVLEAIGILNRIGASGTPIVACDIPSGVDASTGAVAGMAVAADLTVTFHAAKTGLMIEPGRSRCGEISVVDIGIPAAAMPEPATGLIGPSVIRELPVRSDRDDKFSAGSVIVIGGSPGLTGAPMLAALGAARTGAGYVSVALPMPLLSASDAQAEIMGIAASDEDGFHCAKGAAGILERLGEGRSIVIGPGIGRSDSAVEAVELLLIESSCPAVLDADGLRAIAGHPEIAARAGHRLVLTPHAGEMAALLGVERRDVEAERLSSARELARRSGAVCLLKGDDTLVAAPSGTVAVSPGGAPALATAGSGDVLSGMIAALLARGEDPFTAACAAALLHLEAGRLASARGVEGVMAGDIAASIPAARQSLQGECR